MVKVKGGFVTAKRTWIEGKWYFNRAWNNLDIEIDSVNSGIKSITRNGDPYSRGNIAGKSFRFYNRKSIRTTPSGIRWEDRKGNWIDYDAQGKITKYGDRNNVLVSFQYNAAGQRSGVFDHLGTQVLWYTYYPDGKLKSVNDATPVTSRTVQYNYTGADLTEVIDVRGFSWKYTYANGRLTTATDPEGRVTTITYNVNGATKSVKKMDGTGPVYNYNYDKSKKEYYVSVTQSSGRVTETWYNRDAERIRRDINGVTISKIVRDTKKETETNELGQVTVRLLDDFDNVIKTTYPDNNTVSATYDSKYSNILTSTNENGVITKYEYNITGNLIKKIEAFGLPEQRITQYTPNIYGEIEQVKQVGDAVTVDAITNLAYDNQGNLITYTDPENNIISNIKYDLMGNPYEWTDARLKLWKATFDAKGNITQITNPLNFSKRVEYDGRGNRINYFNEYNKLTASKYNTSNRLFEIIDPLLSKKQISYNLKGQVGKILDEENKAKTLQFNNLNSIQKITDGNNNDIVYSYGNATLGARQSQISQVTYPTYNTQFKYDNRGRLIQTINNYDTVKQISSTKYDPVGNVVERIAPDGQITTYQYDGLNRNTKIIDAQLKSIITTYDIRDNVLSVVNENTVTIRTYAYNTNNQKLSINWPNGAKFSYTYDANRKIETITDNKNQFAFIIYDAAGRLTRQEYYQTPAKTTLVKAVDYTYNNTNSLTGYNDTITSSSYSYDDLQRRLSETINYPGFSKTQSFSYYNNNRLKTYTGPDAIAYSHSYDANNQFTSLTIPGEGAITINQKRWFAALKTTLPGGSIQNNVFDGLMRIKSITSLDTASNSIQFSNYTYYSDDNIKTRTTKEGNFSYLYNSVDRLTSVTRPDTTKETFSYDFTGNRITNNTTTGNWAYNTTNQLLNDTVSSYDYNLNGDLNTKTTGTTVQRYIYTIEGRLSEVQNTINTTIASYYYDPFGRRLWKDVAGQRIYFMPRKEGIAAEFNNTGAVIQTYGYEPDTEWGTKPLLTKTSTGTYYYHLDRLGTPQVLTNRAGAVVWQASYSAYGNATISVEQVTNNLRFPGQYFDSESGLHYNYFRYYDPRTGRYITSDPIGLRGGVNTFGYVGGNPLYWSDPYGLMGYPTSGYDAFTEAAIAGVGSIFDFYKGWSDMRDASTIGGDLYFHCRANCEASRRGETGSKTACLLSNERENVQDEPPKDRKKDEAANKQGQEGGKKSKGSCYDVCKNLIPKSGLPKRHLPPNADPAHIYTPPTP